MTHKMHMKEDRVKIFKAAIKWKVNLIEYLKCHIEHVKNAIFVKYSIIFYDHLSLLSM